MKYIHKTGKKYTLLILASLALFACQYQPASMSSPKTITVEFELPNDLNKSPKQTKGPIKADVEPGDFFDVSVSPGSGAILLIILDPKSPFVSGDFVVKLSPGSGRNKKLTIANNRKGTYKYILVDVSGKPGANTRPTLDPYIIVRR